MLFCNPHYLTPSARLPGNPEKVYDGLLGLEGLILVGDMTDGRLRRAGVMEDVLSWRRGTNGGLSASSIVRSFPRLSFHQ